MKIPSKWLAGFLMLAHIWSPIPAIAEDIDIFTGGSIDASNPTILFVLDNQSQWANAAQQWPDYPEQGKSEAAAIRTLLADATVINSGINVGLMEFVTAGNAGNTGGFVRFPVKQMTAANKAVLSAHMDTIFGDITGTSEKRNSGTEYGNLMWDIHNYLAGTNTVDTLNPPNPHADATAYTTPYTLFKSPLTAANGCGRIFMIFIGNNTGSNSPITNDTQANKDALSGLGCSITSLPLPNFTTSEVAQQALLGSGVYASQADCIAAAATTHGAAYSSYSCALTTSVTASTALGTSTCGQYPTAAACEAAQPAAHPGYSSYTCGGATACTVTLPSGTTALGTSTCGQYATAAACQTAAAAAWPGYDSYACASAGGCTSADLDGAACYATSAACVSTVLAANPGYNSVACGSAASCASVTDATTCGGANDYNTAATCNALGAIKLPGYPTYACAASNDSAVCPAAGAKKWTITASGKSSYSAIGTGTRYTMEGTTAGASVAGNTFTITGNTTTNTYNIYGNYTATTAVPTGTYNATANSYMADEWASCLHQKDLSVDGTAAVAEAFTADFSTSGAIVGADTITFDGVTTTLAGGETPAQIAAAVKAQTYPNWTTSVSGNVVTFTYKTTGELANVADSSFTIVDTGGDGTLPVVVVTTTAEGAAATGGALGKQNVTTYVIDVFNAKQNADETALFMSMAQQGGGRYFSAKSQAQILAALKQIISEIQSVNTAFAAASIPLSTTNRSQNLNEVYIGVFRPSLEPRWFGNLKKFKIDTVSGSLDLVDSQTPPVSALNSQTGFLNDCAVSFWTSDSGTWWDQVKIGAATLADNTLLNPVPKSSCVAMPAANTSPWSDLPDGQSVEKGAVAGVIRRGNNPPTTTSSPTWQVNRTIWTRSFGSLVALSAANAGSADLYNYIRGVDINVSGSHVEEKDLSPDIANAVRPSVHGDVVHSRPLAVNYATNNTVIYYGANDGMLRAVDGATGKEKWAFIPKEFLDYTAKQTRLMQDTPAIAFGAAPAVGSTPKDYMFDGSPGIYQSAGTLAAGTMKVWLYPTQRRGGRRIHALNVSNPANNPSLMWYKGCRDLTNDSVCSDNFEDIGQTWSVPVITKIKGYSTTKPVVVFGGGYDNCEDVRPAASPPTWDCSSAKGRVVYVLDAEDGTLLKKFTFAGMRGVTAGVSFVDIDNDGYSDYAYVADLGGAIYRLSFINSPATPTALAKENWSIKKVAYTNGTRKFMFSPAVTFGGGDAVYVALGSGDRERPLAEDYPYQYSIQNYVYGYRDKLDLYSAATTACNLDGDPSAVGACVLDYTAARAACDSPGILPTGSPEKQAWRVGLVHRGEQTVTQAIILGGMVSLNTTRPMPTGVCSAVLGEGGGYFLNLINGSGAIGVDGSCGGDIRGKFTGVGLPTDPVVVYLPGEDPICIGCVSKSNTSDTVGSKLFQPTPIPPPISKKKYRKYRYTTVD